ncbi:MAG: DUF3786 domain-containing protein [Spirochaetaceae bacterium]|jgi:hypothetical protein|nr:DUF3786 domain-containing protein [Spirochaetaceae bacterium]
MNMEKGYMKTYKWVIGLLKDLDFIGAAKRLGLRLISNDEAELDFLGRTYSIARDAVSLKSERIIWDKASEEFDFNVRSVLGYYALSESDVQPTGDFRLLSSFSHGVFASGASSFEKMASPLSIAYGADYGKFREAALKLGMKDEGLQGNGKKWHYELLPKMPVKLIYYEGDDEFPTDIKILFDSTAIQVYKFEPLAVLNGCFAHGLACMGKAFPVGA